MDQETRRFEQASNWLIRLQEDDLPDTEIVRWVEWCEAEPENRRAFERLLPLWQALDTVQSPPDRAVRLASVSVETLALWRQHLTSGSSADQFADVKAGRGGALRKGHARWRTAYAVAATALLSLGILAAWQLTRPKPLAPIASVNSAVAENREAILPDGSTLALGAKSNLAIDFQGAGRRVEMGNGEAFFTVKHDKTHPFVVHAGPLKVVAVGTAFDVLRTGSRIAVTVQEGIVEVTAGQDGGEASSDAQPLRAPAGYQVVYDSAQPASPSLRMVDPAAATAWRQGRLEYIAEPLSSVVANLNRYSTAPIVLDPSIGRLAYTGTIEVRSIDEWIHALPRIFAVHVQQDPNHGVVIEAAPKQAVSG